jgi:hypothetical protein
MINKEGLTEEEYVEYLKWVEKANRNTINTLATQ